MTCRGLFYVSERLVAKHFLVLPWGNRLPDAPGHGHSAGAPARPRIALKLLINTLLAALFTALIVLAMDAGIISFSGESQ